MAKKCINGCSYTVFSSSLCKGCWLKVKGSPIKKISDKRAIENAENKSNTPKIYPKPIDKVSEKRAIELEIYRGLRMIHMDKYPDCQIRVDDKCTIIATELHHQQGREGLLLTDERYFKSACKYCHDTITENSKSAIENGHSISRHKK